MHHGLLLNVDEQDTCSDDRSPESRPRNKSHESAVVAKLHHLQHTVAELLTLVERHPSSWHSPRVPCSPYHAPGGCIAIPGAPKEVPAEVPCSPYHAPGGCIAIPGAPKEVPAEENPSPISLPLPETPSAFELGSPTSTAPQPSPLKRPESRTLRRHNELSAEMSLEAEKESRRSIRHFSDERIDRHEATPMHRLPSLDPNSGKRACWDTLTAFFVVLDSMLIPLSIAFRVMLPQWWLWLSTGFFGMDILLSFRTGFYECGELVMEPHRVAKRYLRTFFWPDVVATMPWEAFEMLEGTQESVAPSEMVEAGLKWCCWMRLVRLFRLVKLGSFVEHLENHFSDRVGVKMRLEYAKLSVLIVFLCHVVACALRLIGDPSINTAAAEDDGSELFGPAWVRRLGLEDRSPVELYTVALTWGTSILTANEAGIVNPANILERSALILIMFTSFMFCAILIGTVVRSFEQRHTSQLHHLERLTTIKHHMRKSVVPLVLQTKVIRFLSYAHQSHHGRHSDDWVRELSPYLQTQLQSHFRQSLLRAHPYFERLPTNALNFFCVRATNQTHAPGDIIITKGVAHGEMNFLTSGCVFDVERNEAYGAPMWFGHACVFGDGGEEFGCESTIEAETHVTVFRVQKADVDYMLDTNPRLQTYHDAYMLTLACKPVPRYSAESLPLSGKRSARLPFAKSISLRSDKSFSLGSGQWCDQCSVRPPGPSPSRSGYHGRSVDGRVHPGLDPIRVDALAEPGPDFPPSPPPPPQVVSYASSSSGRSSPPLPVGFPPPLSGGSPVSSAAPPVAPPTPAYA